MMIVTDSLVPITNYIWIIISGPWKKKHSLAEIKMQTWIWQAVSYIDQCNDSSSAAWFLVLACSTCSTQWHISGNISRWTKYKSAINLQINVKQMLLLLIMQS